MAHLYLDEQRESAFVGETLDLTADEAHHAVSVSRTRVGETILVGNGRGMLWDVRVVATGKNSVRGEVIAAREVPTAHPRVTLVQALTKGDRDERAIEMATELGIDAVIPWAARRSVSVWSADKIVRGLARWRAIVREASKQCVRAHLPIIGEYALAADVVRQLKGCLIVVLDTAGEVTPHAEWLHLIARARQESFPLALVVGPEGGITADERELFLEAGATTVHLGGNVLRSSTAGPAFLSAINSELGRW